MTNKASNADWRQAVRSATGPDQAPASSLNTMANTPHQRVVAGGRKEPLGTYIPESMALQMKEASLKLSRERGVRVTLSDIVTEALREYLAKQLE